MSISTNIFATPVKAAFVYVTPIGDHGWTYAHHNGVMHLKKVFS